MVSYPVAPNKDKSDDVYKSCNALCRENQYKDCHPSMDDPSGNAFCIYDVPDNGLARLCGVSSPLELRRLNGRD